MIMDCYLASLWLPIYEFQLPPLTSKDYFIFKGQ